MTGFSRAGGQSNIDDMAFSWAFEMKSVNGKNLDFKVRLPIWLEAASSDLKRIAQKYFERGTISANLDIVTEDKQSNIKINQELLHKLIATAQEVCLHQGINPPTAGELLSVNGVVEIEKNTFDEKVIEKLQAELLSGFEKCCVSLKEDRQKEGAKMVVVLTNLLNKIENLVTQIEQYAESVPQQIRDKLQKQIADFLGENNNVSEERLAQEIVFFVNRADIREETDRLRAHIKTARQLLQSGESIGRRMDFLCQEFNREANTACSKAADVQIVNCGMELKATIEQLREQVQNME